MLVTSASAVHSLAQPIVGRSSLSYPGENLSVATSYPKWAYSGFGGEKGRQRSVFSYSQGPFCDGVLATLGDGMGTPCWKFKEQKVQTNYIIQRECRYSSAFLGALIGNISFCLTRNTDSLWIGQPGIYQGGSGSCKCHGLHLVCSATSEGSLHNETVNLKSQVDAHAHDFEISSGGLTGEASSGSVTTVHGSQLSNGRSGLVTFYGHGSHHLQRGDLDLEFQTRNWWRDFLWILGPAALLSSVVLPPLHLRKFFEVVLEDSLLTDFLVLFFTEAFFFVGVVVFLFIVHTVQKSARQPRVGSDLTLYVSYKVSSIITMVLAVLLSIGTFAIVWPWTGPAATAALIPYMAGLGMQFLFEQVVQDKKSPVLPVVMIVFQVYRLHQLNRAAQLVAGLLFALKEAEATTETLAIKGSVQILLTVLQLLGMLSLWSLATFLTHAFLPELQLARTSPSSEG
eukprot:c21378_g1_i1 orf=233-1597(+)